MNDDNKMRILGTMWVAVGAALFGMGISKSDPAGFAEVVITITLVIGAAFGTLIVWLGDKLVDQDKPKNSDMSLLLQLLTDDERARLRERLMNSAETPFDGELISDSAHLRNTR